MKLAPAGVDAQIGSDPGGRSPSSSAGLPLWVLLARFYGLYDRDEERTDHSTVDDIVGVFQLVTLGTWSFLVITQRHGLATPDPVSPRRLLADRDRSSCQSCRAVARASADAKRIHPEHRHRRLGRRRPHCSRTRSRSIPNTASTSSASSITTTGGVANGPDSTPATRQHRRAARAGPRRTQSIAWSSHSRTIPRATLDVIRSLQGVDVQIDIVPRLFEVLGRTRSCTRSRASARRTARSALSRSSRLLKRSLDSVVRDARARSASRRSSSSSRLRSSSTRAGPVFFRQVRMGPDGRDVPHPQVPDDGRGRRGAQAEHRAPQHAQRRRLAHVQDPGRPARHTRRAVSPPLADRRAAAADQRARRGA